MSDRIYEDRAKHAVDFLLSDQRNDDFVTSFLKYREQVEQINFGPIIEYINSHSQGKTWTKGLEAFQIVAHIGYLCIHIKELEDKINELETMIQIQRGE